MAPWRDHGPHDTNNQRLQIATCHIEPQPDPFLAATCLTYDCADVAVHRLAQAVFQAGAQTFPGRAIMGSQVHRPGPAGLHQQNAPPGMA
eukprot:scaffold1735_cov119-Isochrysis_galbana.AAC.3